jgi:hypothetical protein
MSEDFRQERRWKIATAFNVAKWVLAWHEALDRSALCIQANIPPPDSSQLLDDTNAGRKSLMEDLTRSSTLSEVARDFLSLDDRVNAMKDLDGTIAPPPATAPLLNDFLIEGESIVIDSSWKAQLEDTIGVSPSQLMISQPITINVDSNTYTIEGTDNLQQGLCHLPTYAPPSGVEIDRYLESDSINPVSKFMLAHFKSDSLGFQAKDSTHELPSFENYTPKIPFTRKLRSAYFRIIW